MLLHWLKRGLICLCCIVGASAFMTCAAQMKIQVKQGTFSPVPIAVPEIYGADKQAKEVAANLTAVMIADLERSGLFKRINPGSYMQDSPSAIAGPRFSEWRVLNAHALVAAECSVPSSDAIEVKFYLWDVLNQQRLEGVKLSIKLKDWRRLAHRMADIVYKRITGEEGYFDSRVIYVSEAGPLNKRIRRLALMDQDGENHKFLTDGQNMVLSPRFSPANPDIIAFLAFVQHSARVYLFNLKTKQQKQVGGKFPGMTFAPRFSPDGNTLTMSYAHEGKTVLTSFDLNNGKFSQITIPVAIDTSPSYSPDGKQIIFMSDRGGGAQLYAMNVDGSNQKRISFGKGSYTAPCWSPRGDWITFIRKYNQEFYLGVMRPDGTGERYLTKGFFIDTPSWSPNGRVIIFMRQSPSTRDGRGGKAKIYSIDVTGYYEREILTPHDASDPSWSPLGAD